MRKTDFRGKSSSSPTVDEVERGRVRREGTNLFIGKFLTKPRKPLTSQIKYLLKQTLSLQASEAKSKAISMNIHLSFGILS